jgi:prepilin-type N-terminal cleavage/methylation domain-containing protein
MSRGFTLIELVAIIVVIGILAAVAVPTLFDARSAATESTVRNFGASLKSAASIYLSRALVEDTQQDPPVKSFMDFVGLTEGASDRNTIRVNESIRNLLEDPEASVLSGDGLTITLQLKGGTQAIYTFKPAICDISESYVGFD